MDEPWAAQFVGWFRPESSLAVVIIERLGYELITRIDFEVEPGDRVELACIEVGAGEGVTGGGGHGHGRAAALLAVSKARQCVPAP
jgi:hypothetical protein